MAMHELLQEWNATRTDYRADQSIHEVFEAQASKTPQATALVEDEHVHTYAELNARANRWAHSLRAMGVQRGDRVAILMQRSAELVVAELAILKCGAAYVPLDQGFPQERLAFLIADCGARVVLVGEGIDVPRGLEAAVVDVHETTWDSRTDNLGVRVGSDALAYVMYTSGSTGLPKGVMVPQRAVNRLVLNCGYADFREDDRVAFSSNPAFDATTMEVWAPLLNGGCVVVVDKATLLEPRGLGEALKRHAVTVLWMTVGLFNQYADSLTDAFSALRYLIVGGDALDARVIARVLRGRPPQHLLNGYGPTECTTFAITHEIRDVAEDATSIPIGRPISNTRVYLLDAQMEPVPVGVQGEIYIGGAGVALGYLNRPELTAERFLDDPFDPEPGSRMYRTGDLGRYRPDGVIEFLGRNDLQIKLRGFRIEPGEIEARLLQSPGVREAAVLARDVRGSGKQLVAYVVAEETLDLEALRGRLRAQLPDFMVPAAYVRLDRMPLTPNGKVDRNALPAPDHSAFIARAYEEPRNETERLVAEAWAAVLGIDRVGRNDDFLALGGDSLTAVQALNRIQQRLRAGVSLHALLTAASLSAFAEELERCTSPAANEEPSSSTGDDEYPATVSQLQVHFFNELYPANRAYQTQSLMRIRGPLDTARLERALLKITDRHEHLRSTYHMKEDGTLVGRVHPRVDGDCYRVEDVSEEDLPGAISRKTAEVIDASRLPLLKWTLFRIGADDHALLMVEHHYIHDGWSFRVYLAELAALYEADGDEDDANLAAPVQFRELAHHQKRSLSAERVGAMKRAWSEYLEGVPHELKLPVPTRSPATALSGGQVRLRLPASLSDSLRDAAAALGATPFQFLFAAFAVLLSRYTSKTKFLLGSSTANRNQYAWESVIGMLVNTIPVSVDLDGVEGFAAAVTKLGASLMQATALGELPFPEIVTAVAPERARDTTPLVQISFNGHNALDKDIRLRGLELEIVEAVPNGTAKFDLSVICIPCKRGQEVELIFEHSDRFDRATIERLTEHYRNVVRALAADPHARIGELPLLDREERLQVLERWNDTAAEFPGETLIHELIEAQVEKTPEAVAVVDEARTLTYRALNAQANQLAHYLRELGVGPEKRVALCMERSVEMVVSLLAVLKAGGAYVPLDPTYPAERLQQMLDDSDPVVVLRKELNESLWAGRPRTNPTREATGLTSRNLAYVIYTSGSTGRPKGVMNEHRGVVNRLVWMQKAYALNGEDAVLQKTPYGFDVSVWELFWPLQNGARLVMARPDGHRDPRYLSEIVQRERITTVHFVPSMLQAFLDHGDIGGCTTLKRVVCSGEALPAPLARRCQELLPNARLSNLYGPTEAAVDVTAWDYVPGWTETRIPIGRPIANTRMYVLDGHGEPVPAGVAGELYIGGVQVARGYLNRPELTAERFMRDPFSGDADGRMYRTGDLGRHLPDGNIEFLGRNDFQVKIRGFRIELGEIEARLAEHAGVREAVVVARDDATGDKRLVAYVTASAEQRLISDFRVSLAADLRASLAATLPEHMIPSAIVVLDALPLTANGKLDRNALPAPDAEAYSTRAYEAARGETETVVASIWADLLGLERVGRNDHFFEVGGHSILAVRTISRLRQALGIEVSLGTLFAHPVLADFAGHLSDARQATLPPIVRAAADERRLLSFAQQRLWFLAQLDRDSTAYHIHFGLRLTGPLDREALRRALDLLVARHEAFRTRFFLVDGEPVQHIAAAGAPFALVEHDLRGLEDAQTELQRLTAEESSAPFDLQRGPLVRGRLIRLADDDHTLLLTQHHIISDGWSLEIMLRELGALYAAGSLPPLEIQYADYAAWQRRWMSGDVLQAQSDYWRTTLSGAPALLALPADRERPAQQDPAGEWIACGLDAELTRGIRALSRRNGTTVFATLLASWAALLARLSGQDDLIVGIPVANRGRTEIEGLLGFFANTLPLRIDVSGSPSVSELLARVRAQSLAAQQNQDIPFEQIVEIVRPARTLAHSPLFQVMFAWQPALEIAAELPGLTVAALPRPRQISVKFDLSLSLAEAGSVIKGRIDYATSLFERSTVERFLRYWRTLLEAMVTGDGQAVDRLPLLQTEERESLAAWNETAAAYPDDRSIHELFEAQAERRPDATAVIQDGRQLTYRELNESANRLARYLREQGVGPDRRVAIRVARRPEMIVALLAVLKAGGAYVPLDPSYPPERTRFILEDSDPVVILTEEMLSAAKPAWSHHSGSNLGPNEAGPEHLAYVIYTSGSTGKPKGVLIEHRSVCNQVGTLIERFGLGSGDRILQFASITFDVSVEEIFCALLSGATLVLRNDRWLTGGSEFWALCGDAGITFVNLPTRFWQTVANDPSAIIPPSVRVLIVGGEALDRESVAAWFRREGHRPPLFNAYGPTETTINATIGEVTPDDAGVPSIGRPTPNTRIYIVDAQGQPVPAGIVGELCIAGVGVARGYLNRPELTAERFVTGFVAGKPKERIYRSGDLARYRADGRIEFLGRNDQQVKIRGFRIELGEIEARLAEHPAVREVVVLAREDVAGGKALVAYVVPAADAGVSAEELRRHLAERVPDYMIPAAYVRLASMPLTASAKVDRKALPAPQSDAYAVRAYEAPLGVTETSIAEIWASLLETAPVGRHDNFFDLGGHSLLVTKLLLRIRREMGVDLEVRDVFVAPTVASLAVRVIDAGLAQFDPSELQQLIGERKPISDQLAQ